MSSLAYGSRMAAGHCHAVSAELRGLSLARVFFICTRCRIVPYTSFPSALGGCTRTRVTVLFVTRAVIDGGLRIHVPYLDTSTRTGSVHSEYLPYSLRARHLIVMAASWGLPGIRQMPGQKYRYTMSLRFQPTARRSLPIRLTAMSCVTPRLRMSRKALCRPSWLWL